MIDTGTSFELHLESENETYRHGEDAARPLRLSSMMAIQEERQKFKRRLLSTKLRSTGRLIKAY